MQTKTSAHSGIFTLRVVLGCALLCLSALATFVALAASPASGTISPTGPTLNWTGTASGAPPTGGGESSCIEGTNCDSFKLTISGTPQDWIAAGKQVHVQITWVEPGTDYDLYVHKGTLSGPVVASSGSGGSTIEQVDMNPANSSIGTGDFVVHVVYFITVGSADQYNGSATVTGAPSAPIPAPAPSAGLPPRFENLSPPYAGSNTLGRNAGEPSIGVGLPITDHPEGRALFQSDVQTLRVTFNGACAKPLWENKPAPTSQVDFDPILFTDRETGRTVVHLLTFAGNVIAGESSVTDTTAPGNDGDVWQPSKGSGIASGVDHQTVGGGRYHAPLPSQKPVGYPNAVYYCSQALVDASCARSDDGGINYGPSFVTYTSECGGLHGHVKVGPDGTVYLPNPSCGGTQAVVVSEDNGTTWQVRPIPGSTTGDSDPAVSVDSAGKLYAVYANANTKAVVTTSMDRGKTWSQPLDIGAAVGINNLVFPAIVAGDSGRAAVGFLGTGTTGGLQGPKFTGIWHVYVAMTYDGGATWTTVDATPNDPVQRGCVWLGGGSNICRNLLDFIDVQMDQEGRVLVAYADGCVGGECVQAPESAVGNGYTAFAAIARQSGGRRLLAKFDAATSAATAPGMPLVSAKRNDGYVQLSWSQGDNGGSPITAYEVLRGTSPGGEALLATLPGSQLTYNDTTASNTSATYFYKVVAVNALGRSCGDNEVGARYVGNSFSAAGLTVAADPTGDQTGAPANADLDIQSLSISEPNSGPNAGRLVFNLKVADLSSSPNDRMWRIIWNSPNAPSGQYYVGMTKDASGTVSFEYGTVATTVVGLVVGVQQTTTVGPADFGNAAPNGLITIAVARNKVGSPRPGDILGGLTVRTFPAVSNVIRSTAASDTTANATGNDNASNASTYAVTGAAPAQLLNISTRANVQTDDNVLIGGFIITGNDPKRVLLRGIGPSLSGSGIGATLQDPFLELHTAGLSNSIIATNDNWKDTQQSDISATGIAPPDDREAAIVQTLLPGSYTVILRGKGSDVGVALVEVYDLSQLVASQLANISSRGLVNTGDDVMIGGFIVGPAGIGRANVLVRGIGPSLSQNGVSGPLADPMLELHDVNGATIATNNNWQESQQSAIEQTGIPPSDPREAAIIAPLNPGNYTAVLRGANNGTGVALVEIYNLP